ncbi:SIMPL domain-containing protein [Christiangramia aquimixticola]|uniref:SIMPL domain-containing protein n=1 Tax=Christiangramia aquimixticola TaxID=1697558 RepID=UPI003AA7FB4F
MKRYSVLVVLFLMTALTSITAQENSVVNVSGEGTVKVVPNEVILKSRIEHEGDSATTVKRKNDEVVRKVIKYLKSQGIEDKYIQTQYVNLNKNYNYNEKTYSYVANQSISITLKDISKYEKIMNGLLENGLNRIDGIQFSSSEMEKYEKEARKIAVLDAQSKAKQLAEPLGQSIGKAVAIAEVNYNNVQPLYKMSEEVMAMGQDSGQSIAPGELEIKIRVNIGFELK